jgi:hypothetical protein
MLFFFHISDFHFTVTKQTENMKVKLSRYTPFWRWGSGVQHLLILGIGTSHWSASRSGRALPTVRKQRPEEKFFALAGI